MNNIPEMQVSELTNTWPNDHEASIGAMFEAAIRGNADEGYKLHSWRFTTVLDQDEETATETIVAVFEKDV